jgi:hypothetical protein
MTETRTPSGKNVRDRRARQPGARNKPNPLTFGPIGVLLTGSYIFNGMDAGGKMPSLMKYRMAVAVTRSRTGDYHYHATNEYHDTLGAFRGTPASFKD